MQTTINAKNKSFGRVLKVVSEMMETCTVEPILISMDQGQEKSLATESSHTVRESVLVA